MRNNPSETMNETKNFCIKESQLFIRNDYVFGESLQTAIVINNQNIF